MKQIILQPVIEYFTKHKAQMYLFFGAVILAVCVVLTLLAFDVFVHTPDRQGATKQRFTVVNGQGLRAISVNLRDSHLVSNDLMFMVYMKLSGLSGTIQSGNYDISASMTPMEIADILSKGKVASVTITIPEGWTVTQIGAYLEKHGLVKQVDFIAATKEKYSYDFLDGKPDDVSLEGYLFPDTYQVSVTANSESLVKMMLENFDKRVTPNMRAAADKSGLGLYKTITLASIVEQEADKPADRKVVAGIFISRLNDGMKLQSDVTVAYGLGESKKDLTAADLQSDSPYNTYVVPGLPKGPICNPGLESINAVLYPEITDFRYFIAANDQMYYAKTLEEQTANVAKYLK